MSKISAREKNKNRERLVAKCATKRARLKATVYNRDLPLEERFKAQLELSSMPRNGAKTRLRNRCLVTGRPRSFYRKFKLCRNVVREMGAFGLIPGMTKASW